jgi:hypothetical protein
LVSELRVLVLQNGVLGAADEGIVADVLSRVETLRSELTGRGEVPDGVRSGIGRTLLDIEAPLR